MLTNGYAELNPFLVLCQRLDIRIKHDKRFRSKNAKAFHGIKVDMVAMKMRLHQDKLD